jgi:3-phenylpropionate/trans-cinnamate dioxygenase ferredoxin component
MVFVNVILKKDVPKGKTKLVEVNGNQILISSIGDEYLALGNKCTHRGCKLSNGVLSGENIKCGCHGSIFNAKTGDVLHGPATQPLPKYGIRLEQDQIQIST